MNLEIKTWLRTRQGKQVVWTSATLVLYALIGFLLLPVILVRVIPKQAGELLGRPVRLEKVRINPFALSASLQGLQVQDLDGSTLLSWDEVYGNFQLSSLWHWAFTFKEVRVARPYAHFQINSNYTFNISDILDKFQTESPQSAPNEEPARLPALRVARLQITNAVTKVSDLTLREPFHREIGPVAVVIKQFHTHPDNANPYSFAGSTEAGERFAWSGRFFLFPLRSEGALRIENVRIPNYAPFYRDFVSFTIPDGVIDLEGSYRLEYGGTNNLLTISNANLRLTSLKVHDAAAAASTENALELAALQVSGVEADLWKRTARIQSVRLDGGQLLVRRNKDATLNLVNMTQPAHPDAAPAGAVLYAMRAATNFLANFLATTNQAVAVLERLDIGQWAFQLEDDANLRPVRLRLDDIRVQGTNLSNISGENLSLNLACRWNTNGTVNIGIAAQLFPIHSDITLQIHRIELPPLDPYAEPFANVLLLDSKFSLEGLARIRRTTREAPFDLSFQGDLRLDDFSCVDGFMGTGLAEWKSLRLAGVQADLHPLATHIEQITLDTPRLRLVVETNRTINVLNALQVGNTNPPPLPSLAPSAKAATTPTSTTDTPSSPPVLSPGFERAAITVSSVLLTNAAIEVRDVSTVPPLRWTVTDVHGRIGKLSSTNLQRAEVQITAKAGQTAPVQISGQLNPLNPAVDTDVAVKLNGMDLLAFSPYSGRYAGYQLRKGSLSLDLQYQIRGHDLKSENLIVLDQLTLGRKVESPEATKLPVKLGVAILKDRNGVIELDVPVEGNLEDPEFRLGRVIGRTLMITLTKMLTSPFSLLGGLVGGSAEELSSFEFAPGSASLPLSATNGLQKLAKALFERPQLEVDIQGSIAPDTDGLALKRQKLTRQLQQLRWEELRESAQAQTKPEQLVLSPDLRQTLLRKSYAQLFPSEARATKPPPGLEEPFYERLTTRLLEHIQVTEDDFRALATARADTIQAHLVNTHNVEPGRLFRSERESGFLRGGSKAVLELQ